MPLISLQQVQSDVNKILAKYFDEQIRQARNIDPLYGELWQSTANFVLGGGKRFRPYLVVLSHQAAGGADYQAILPVAVSLELLHASLLIHDDIIDRDYTRYGADNVAGYFRKKYIQSSLKAEQVTHFADSAALLAGDAVLAAAHDWLIRADFRPNQKMAALNIFSQIVFDVAGGELLDTTAILQPPEEVDTLKTARYKTASYSLVGPLTIGAVLANTPAGELLKLRRLGETIGIAYQLADDLLGLFGQQATTGKPNLSDLREGKRTYLIQQTLQQASSADQKYLLTWLGQARATHSQLKRVQQIAVASGAKAATEALIAEYHQSALAQLKDLNWPENAKTTFKGFIQKALQRKA